MSTDEPVELERAGWAAERDTVLTSMSGAPWSTYTLEDVACSRPTPDLGVVHYVVRAERDDQEYTALISSTYVRREGAWRLAFHQQTPY